MLLAAGLLLMTTAAAFASSGKAHSSRKHGHTASASSGQSGEASKPAPVRRKAYMLAGRLYEDLSTVDANGNLNIWIEDLGSTDSAGFDVEALYVSLTDFGMGGSAHQIASDLGSRRPATNRTKGPDQPAVPAPGPPTPGKWVDQYGREMSHEE